MIKKTLIIILFIKKVKLNTKAIYTQIKHIPQDISKISKNLEYKFLLVQKKGMSP